MGRTTTLHPPGPSDPHPGRRQFGGRSEWPRSASGESKHRLWITLEASSRLTAVWHAMPVAAHAAMRSEEVEMHWQAATLVAAFMAGGCAIVPATEDFSRVDTLEIANRIKCEARDAVRGQIVGVIKRRAQPGSYDERVVERLLAARDFQGIDRQRLHPESRNILAKFDPAVVTLDFTFNLSEENNANGLVGIGWPIHRGPLTITTSGAFNRTRQTLTTFRTQNDFRTLAYDISDDHCDFRLLRDRTTPRQVPGPNPIYPITGEIGLDRQIRDFVNLMSFESLAVRPAGPENAPSTSATYKFITRLVLSVEASAKLEILGPASQVTGAGGKAEVIRIDDHQLIMVLSLPPTPSATTELRQAKGMAKAGSPSQAAAAAGAAQVERQLLLRSLLTSESQERALTRLTRCPSGLLLAFCN